MRKTKNEFSKITLIFLFLLFLLSAENSFACSCFPLPSIYEAFNRAEEVFTGKILSSEDVKSNGYTERHYRVQLLENFKGVKENELTISAGIIESSCFWGGYKVGESYLIYTHGENNNVLNAENACTRTTTLRNAQDQIFFIRELLNGKPESKVYGSVEILENDLQTDEIKERTLSGLEVTVKSKNKTFRALTDKNGVYRFNNLPEGIYKLQLTVPAKYKLYFPESENFKVLKNKKVCRDKYSLVSEVKNFDCYFMENISSAIYLKFALRWNNEMKGKILDSEGKILDKAKVRLLTLAKAQDTFDKDWRDDYRRAGEDYFVIGKTPGQYVLAVEIDSPLGSNNRIRFFYPQASSVEKAQIFNITETTQLNLNFKLGEEIKTRKLVGEVLRENGGSVGGFVWVSLDSMEDVNKKENKRFGMMSINAQGRFEFDTLENEEYWLHVWIDDFEQSGEKKVIKSEKIKIGKEETPRKILVSIPQN